MSRWTLNNVALDDDAIINVVKTTHSQATDTVTFDLVVAQFEDDPLLAPGDIGGVWRMCARHIPCIRSETHSQHRDGP